MPSEWFIMARSSSPGVGRPFFPGLPESALRVMGGNQRLADPEPLRKVLEACEASEARRREN
jgi:hypothetical protein